MIKIIFSTVLLVNISQADYLRDDTKNIVLDTSTNLMWQDDTPVSSMTWENAISYCENLSLGGYSDWKLPNINELYNLADRTTYSPAISSVFQNIDNLTYYWSSTTTAGDSGDAWDFSFLRGTNFESPKSYSRIVRCVRISDM
jgi:hypothetical protein